MARLDRVVLVALLAWLAAVVGSGVLLDGYSHAQHPVALPGAGGMPHALAFNLLAFALPGVLMVVVAWRLRDRLPPETGLPGRLGASLLLLAALGFVAQGVFPLELEHLDSGDSRWHAAAWTVWWIAFPLAAVLLAVKLRALRLSTMLALLLVIGLGMLLPQLLGGGISQRLALLAWFAWTWCAVRAIVPGKPGTCKKQ